MTESDSRTPSGAEVPASPAETAGERNEPDVIRKLREAAGQVLPEEGWREEVAQLGGDIELAELVRGLPATEQGGLVASGVLASLEAVREQIVADAQAAVDTRVQEAYQEYAKALGLSLLYTEDYVSGRISKGSLQGALFGEFRAYQNFARKAAGFWQKRFERLQAMAQPPDSPSEEESSSRSFRDRVGRFFRRKKDEAPTPEEVIKEAWQSIEQVEDDETKDNLRKNLQEALIKLAEGAKGVVYRLDQEGEVSDFIPDNQQIEERDGDLFPTEEAREEVEQETKEFEENDQSYRNKIYKKSVGLVAGFANTRAMLDLSKRIDDWRGPELSRDANEQAQLVGIFNKLSEESAAISGTLVQVVESLDLEEAARRFLRLQDDDDLTEAITTSLQGWIDYQRSELGQSSQGSSATSFSEDDRVRFELFLSYLESCGKVFDEIPARDIFANMDLDTSEKISQGEAFIIPEWKEDQSEENAQDRLKVIKPGDKPRYFDPKDPSQIRPIAERYIPSLAGEASKKREERLAKVLRDPNESIGKRWEAIERVEEERHTRRRLWQRGKDLGEALRTREKMTVLFMDVWIVAKQRMSTPGLSERGEGPDTTQIQQDLRSIVADVKARIEQSMESDSEGRRLQRLVDRAEESLQMRMSASFPEGSRIDRERYQIIGDLVRQISRRVWEEEEEERRKEAEERRKEAERRREMVV